jgi:indolepyruvate ferredoxin oxidoreductase
MGPWIEPALWLLARMRRLRGSALDPFGRAEVRRLERDLVGWYLGLLDRGLEALRPETAPAVAELLSLPDGIRGYEGLKLESARRTRERAETLLKDLGGASRPLAAAS